MRQSRRPTQHPLSFIPGTKVTLPMPPTQVLPCTQAAHRMAATDPLAWATPPLTSPRPSAHPARTPGQSCFPRRKQRERGRVSPRRRPRGCPRPALHKFVTGDASPAGHAPMHLTAIVPTSLDSRKSFSSVPPFGLIPLTKATSTSGVQACPAPLPKAPRLPSISSARHRLVRGPFSQAPVAPEYPTPRAADRWGSALGSHGRRPSKLRQPCTFSPLESASTALSAAAFCLSNGNLSEPKREHSGGLERTRAQGHSRTWHPASEFLVYLCRRLPLPHSL